MAKLIKNILINFIPKKIRTICNFIFLVSIFNGSSALYSQTYSWHKLPNSPYHFGRYENISFINGNTGWLIHAYGTVYRTLDGGESWLFQDSIYLGSFRSVNFINESTGWIGSLNSEFVLFKTTTGGFNWSIVNNIPDPKPRGICGLHSLNDQFIYGCGRYDAFANFIKSTDGGNTWMTKDMTPYATSLVDCHFFNKDTGIAIGGLGTNMNTRKSIVLYTIDGGANWSIKYLGTRNSEWGWKISFTDNLYGFISLERIGNPIKYFIKTSDGGLTWTEHMFPNSNEQGIGFINPNTGWIGGNFNPTYGTTDGGVTWFNSNIGMNINRFQMFGDTLGYACGQYVYKFSKTTGITLLNSEIPDGFKLYQNYPNPFNPVTNIIYTTAKNQFISLKVYDFLGKHILTLVNQKQHAGTYEVKFDGTNLSSGIYYYRFESENFSNVKKMLLLK